MGKYDNMPKNVADQFRQWELNQQKINAYRMPLCIGKLRKIATSNSNWELYYDTQYKFVLSIAKPISGASNSGYGNLMHIKKQLREGILHEKDLTKYGRRLLSLN